MGEAYSSETRVRPNTINNTIKVVVKAKTTLATEDISNTVVKAPGPAIGESQRKDRDIVFTLSLALLADGSGTQTRLACKHHIDGQKKQPCAGGDTEGGQADTQCGQQSIAGKIEHQ
jgi:hypothetical protein